MVCSITSLAFQGNLLCIVLIASSSLKFFFMQKFKREKFSVKSFLLFVVTDMKNFKIHMAMSLCRITIYPLQGFCTKVGSSLLFLRKNR